MFILKKLMRLYLCFILVLLLRFLHVGRQYNYILPPTFKTHTPSSLQQSTTLKLPEPDTLILFTA